jgi:hypothetical protein
MIRFNLFLSDCTTTTRLLLHCGGNPGELHAANLARQVCQLVFGDPTIACQLTLRSTDEVGCGMEYCDSCEAATLVRDRVARSSSRPGHQAD